MATTARAVTGAPVSALFELLGRRWALRLMWELRGGDSLGFRELQSRCEMSPSVLSQRLVDLRGAKLVETDKAGDYRLTKDGLTLLESLAPLEPFAKRWYRKLGR